MNMMMSRAWWSGVGVVGVLVGAVGLANAPSDLPEMDGVPTAEPEAVGMSSERLERLDTVMQGYVERNEVAGAVTLVARRGKVVHFSAAGQRDAAGRVNAFETAFRVTTPRSRRARSSDPEGSRMARRSPHAAGCPA